MIPPQPTNSTAQKKHARAVKWIVYFTLFYVSGFGLAAIARGDVEFIYYTALLSVAITVILLIHKRFQFYPFVLMALSGLGLLHLLGGNYFIGNIRLYDFFLIPHVFRYDNFVHMVGSGIMTMLAYAMLNPVVKNNLKRNDLYFVILLVLVSLGLGAVNELVEFFGVILFDVGNMVGGYTNTLLDLVYNTIGSIIIAVLLVTTKIPLVKLQ